ncbi:unnamed protein product [Gadus morhua 'NCC']
MRGSKVQMLSQYYSTRFQMGGGREGWMRRGGEVRGGGEEEGRLGVEEKRRGRRPLFMWDPVLLVLTLPMSIKVLRGCLWACPRDPSSANVSLATGVDQGKDDSQASVQ